MTKEEMEGPILFWGYKEQESHLILPEHDDDEVNFIVAITEMYVTDPLGTGYFSLGICRAHFGNHWFTGLVSVT